MVMRFFRIVTRSKSNPPAVTLDAPLPDRRRSPRVALYAHCDAYDPIRFQTRPRCKLVNVGLQGIGLETPFPAGRGDDFALTFSVGRDRIANARAVLMWSRPQGTGSFSGVQFVDRSIGSAVRRALIRHIKAAQA